MKFRQFLPRPAAAAWVLCAGAVLLAGCASTLDGPVDGSAAPETHAGRWTLNEKPVPEGAWRPHRLARCAEDVDVPAKVERYLGIGSEFFRHGSGSDGMIELELGLQAGVDHPLILLTLGQLYLLAGQGDPALLPVEGPAADTGSWPRNKKRLLDRAETLLERCAALRPDDAAVDYLLADVARAREHFGVAQERVWTGEQKCTGGRSFRILKMYQLLNDYPPRWLGGPAPEYPARALDDGITGEVVLDLLLDPRGEVMQAVVVQSPSADLSRAAEESFAQGTYEAARIGKYTIWSWLRVKTSFRLEGD